MPGHDVNVAEFDGVQLSDSTTPRAQLVELMNRFEQPLSNYLLVLLGDRDAVRDCAQDTFLRAYEHLQRGRCINSQWLYKVARNRAIDDLRRKQRVQAMGTTSAMSEFLDRTGVDFPLDRPESGVNARIESVRRALALLSSSDREILYLFVVDRFETAEIATMLGIRPGAARVRLTRARERFRIAYRGL